MSDKEDDNNPEIKFTVKNTTTMYPEINPDVIKLKVGCVELDDKPEPAKDDTVNRLEAFREELTTLLNTYSLEEIGGDTPDFILADYLTECLINYGKTTKIRTTWY